VTAPNVKGYDEQGRFNPLLAMKAQQELIDKLMRQNEDLQKRVNVLRYAYGEEVAKRESV